MKRAPWDVEAFEADKTLLVIAPYTESNSKSVDMANADAELDKKILFAEANWKGSSGGYRESADTGGIASVTEAVGIVTITMLNTWESADDLNLIIPIVEYKGHVVPYEHINDISSQVAKTIKIDNGATGGNGMYSAVAADYTVYLIGALWGCVKSVKLPDVALPLTVTKTKAIGHQDPVRTTQKREGKDTTGRVTFIPDNKLIQHAGAGAPVNMNKPGEDLMNVLYGADNLVSPNWNEIDYNDKIFAVALLQLSGEISSTTVDTAIGKVFAKETRIYHCQLTNRPGSDNIEGGAADSTSFDIEFNSRHGASERIVKFITDGAAGSKLNT